MTFNDPVAQRIQSELSRDAIPSPEERERKHKKHLTSEGCHFCSFDDNAKQLNMTTLHTISCPRYQSHPTQIVYCDSCGFDRDYYLRWKRSQSHRDSDSVVVYDCGHSIGVNTPPPETTTVKQQTGYTDDGTPTYEKVEIKLPEEPTPPEAPIKCPNCQSDISHVFSND